MPKVIFILQRMPRKTECREQALRDSKFNPQMAGIADPSKRSFIMSIPFGAERR